MSANREDRNRATQVTLTIIDACASRREDLHFPAETLDRAIAVADISIFRASDGNDFF
jgi:hypothetical protein